MNAVTSPNLWSDTRRPRAVESQEPHAELDVIHDEGDAPAWRSVFQQDFDRLLFSTPVRRLSDKTQVWPMDENDGVRTRLTHSHEVANLARSLGSRIATEQRDIFDGADLHCVVQPILWAIGLAHDLGNPPFGHQGEAAIGDWFEKRKKWIFCKKTEKGEKFSQPLSEAQKLEFLKFDGNPQTLRLVTRLQTHAHNLGLDLSAATLAAMLKYPVSALHRNKEKPAHKKVGYFQTEEKIVKWIRAETGLEEGQRHPLTWIMEACDDIAYSILDVDDVMKKGVASPDDVLTLMRGSDGIRRHPVIKKIETVFKKVDDSQRDVFVSRDIKIGYMRAHLMDALIQEAAENFLENAANIKTYDPDVLPILEKNDLCNFLKDIAKTHAFSNPSVLKAEACGAEAIKAILSFFWEAIYDRENVVDIMSRRGSARAKFAWSLVSSNYVEEANRCIRNANGDEVLIRYAELRLLTDMVSGMTDSFAMKLWEDIKALP